MRTKAIFIGVVPVLAVGLMIWFLVYRPRAVEQELATAVELVRSGDCRGAVMVLRKLVSASPDTVQGREARLLLARCRTRLGDYPEAAALWEDLAAADDPALQEEAAFYLAWITEERGESESGGEMLSAYLRRYPDSPRTGRAYLALARLRKSAGDSQGARTAYRDALKLLPPGEPLARTRKELGECNLSRLFSPEIDEESLTYTIRAGDSLAAIARAYNTTTPLLQKMNRISGEIIHPGQVLKVPGFRFEAVVSKSLNTLTLLYGGSFFKEYSVGTGRGNCSPTGEFAIVTKLVNPPWIHGGETIPPFDPRNILGTRWMGFGDPYASYGIHGTTQPETIGAQSSDGCVRMLNQEVEELFIFLPRGTRVVIEE